MDLIVLLLLLQYIESELSIYCMYHIKMLINERFKIFSGGTPLMETANSHIFLYNMGALFM